MEDVRLIFLAPDGRLSDAGVREDGSTACRYYGNDDRIEDVVVHRDNTWEIETYSNNYELLRRIRAFSVRDGIPEMVELTGFGFREYSLRLKLISAEPVSPETHRSRPGLATEPSFDRFGINGARPAGAELTRRWRPATRTLRSWV